MTAANGQKNEFVQYMGRTDADDIYVSEDATGETEHRVFGESVNRPNYGRDLEPIGITFHSPVPWEDFSGRNEKDSDGLETLLYMSEHVGIPLVWIHNTKEDYQNAVRSNQLDQDIEFGVMTANTASDTRFKFSGETIPLRDLEPEIQDVFGTSYRNMGGSKEPNEWRSSFNDFTMEFLPSAYSITDIDAFHAPEPGHIKSLIELKRAEDKPTEWTPWPNDTSQYCLLFRLAEMLNSDKFIFKHQKKPLYKEDVRLFQNLRTPELGDKKKFGHIQKGDYDTAEAYIGDRGESMHPIQAITKIRGEKTRLVNTDYPIAAD
jgi:hypothetical protein